MSKRALAVLGWFFLCAMALTALVKAEDQSFTDQFLGSPLLILVILVILVALAFLYHKIRK